MPRVNLLIADDVGLGKTIESGMVVLELVLRHRANRVLVVCPSSLQIKWQDEMLEIRIEQVKFPSSNVAVVHGIVELFNAPPYALGENHFTRVVVKEHGRWLISSFQNTQILRPGPTPKR